MPDPLYVKAREILLDALDALGAHRSSVVLVGAQAIYLHTGEADLALAPFTTDADLVLEPDRLAPLPLLGAALGAAGFVTGHQPGEWSKDDVRVDLMVPEAVAGPGRRGVRLGPHGNRVARKARGLEGALVDRAALVIESFESRRQTEVLVAGPSALLVSKLHKLDERKNDPRRLHDKDAHDILRLLRGATTDQLRDGILLLLEDVRSAEVTAEGLRFLSELFGTPDAPGSTRAARATEGLDDPRVIAASCAALAEELLVAVADSV